MKKIILFFITTSFLLIAVVSVSAQVISREQVKLDENLYNKEKANEFMQPKSIVIVPIKAPIDHFTVDATDWFRGIYYYFTGRVGMGDIPFHYVISSEGQIFWCR